MFSVAQSFPILLLFFSLLLLLTVPNPLGEWPEKKKKKKKKKNKSKGQLDSSDEETGENSFYLRRRRCQHFFNI